MNATEKPIETLEDVSAYKPAPMRKFFSASHEEILAGLTADVYFVKANEVLRGKNMENTVVTAEIFARREGIVAGIPEVMTLISGRGLKIQSLTEGEIFAPKEVIMRICGPYQAFGIHETAILGILASSCGWATAARACKEAAGDSNLLSFGARHVHPAVAPVMERAAIIGGADSASCILGAKLAGQEPVGTLPHAVFLIIGDTVEVAETYDEVLPPDAPRLILVDTFKDEAEETLRVANALKSKLAGVRLDTPSERGGVTPDLVREIRSRLDQSGFQHVKIFVSGGITPDRIRILKDAGAHAFGVGSFISGASPIDMTMDLKEIAGKPIAKRGRIPGITFSVRLTDLE